MASELKQGEYLCTSHFEIEIEGKSYKVLWEIKPDNAAVGILSNPQSAANDYLSDLDEKCNEDNESDESDVAFENQLFHHPFVKHFLKSLIDDK